jgi:hypothetical protein
MAALTVRCSRTGAARRGCPSVRAGMTADRPRAA